MATKRELANKVGVPASGTNMQERFLTVGLYPQAGSTLPWIRLRGQWQRQAGFAPRTRVRVRVMNGCLVLTAEQAL